MADNLFVYGTLHPERAPGEIAEAVHQLRPVGKGTIRARLHRFKEYPAVKIDSKNGSRISGQVFQVPNEGTLRKLDEYEEFDPLNLDGSLFLRRKVRVKLSDGPTLECWVYEYNKGLPAKKQMRQPRPGPTTKRDQGSLTAAPA